MASEKSNGIFRFSIENISAFLSCVCVSSFEQFQHLTMWQRVFPRGGASATRVARSLFGMAGVGMGAGLFFQKSPDNSLTTPFTEAELEAETPVQFNKNHYPNGLNAGFLKRSKTEAVAFYAPKFESPEHRDIAANQDKILDNLGGLENKIILDVGSGTGFFLKALSERAGPSGRWTCLGNVMSIESDSGRCPMG